MNTFYTSFVVLSLSVAMAGTAVAGNTVGNYKLIDLGTTALGGCTASGLNNVGKVVGYGLDATNQNKAWIFDVATGTRTDLPRPSDFRSSLVMDINDSGKMVGYGQKNVSGSYYNRGLYWSDMSVPVQISAFNALTTGSSYLYDINEYGLCAGAANGQQYNGVPSNSLQGMTYYAPTNVKSFRGTIDDQAGSTAVIKSINSTGVSVGYGYSVGANALAMRDNGSGGMFPMGDPAGTTNGAYAESINNFNGIAGTYYVSASQAKAFYKNNYNAAITIPRLPGATGDDSNTASSVNGSGHVVGDCEIGNTNRHAFIWNGVQVYDLNTATMNLNGNTLRSATAINEKQWVVGQMTTSGGGTNAFLLRPVQVIQGTIDLQDFVGQISSIPVEWELVNASNQVLESGTFTPNILKMYALETTVQEPATLRLKPSHWLSKSISVDLTEAWTAISQPWSFINGDVDGDNVVSVFDYIRLSDGFDKAKGDAGFDKEADLDGDNVVSVFDYIILSDHFDMQGE